MGASEEHGQRLKLQNAEAVRFLVDKHSDAPPLQNCKKQY